MPLNTAYSTIIALNTVRVCASLAMADHRDDADRTKWVAFNALCAAAHAMHQAAQGGLNAKIAIVRRGGEFDKSVERLYQDFTGISAAHEWLCPPTADVRNIGYMGTILFAPGSHAHEVADWLFRNGGMEAWKPDIDDGRDASIPAPAWGAEDLPHRPLEARK